MFLHTIKTEGERSCKRERKAVKLKQRERERERVIPEFNPPLPHLSFYHLLLRIIKPKTNSSRKTKSHGNDSHPVHLLLPPTFPSIVFLISGSDESIKRQKTPIVDVNIGTDVSNLFTLEDLVAFLKSQQITHIRLYDANPALLAALTGTGIRVVLSVPNNQLLTLGSFNATAVAWVARHVLPFHPHLRRHRRRRGRRFLPSALHLLPALRSLSSAISSSSSSADPLIKLSTPLPFSIILDPFPPSQAFFN